MTERPERTRIETELVHGLASMPLMQHPDSRQLFVRRLRHRLKHQVEIRDFPQPHLQSVEVVGACWDVSVGLAAMVEEIKLLAPEASQVRLLQRLVHERDVLDVLANEDWSELAPALRGCCPQNLGWLYQRATNHREASAPDWCEDAWGVFVHLSGQNAPASGLPPGMLFLLQLEYEVDADVASVLYRRNQREASRLDLTAEFDRHRAALNLTLETPDQPYLYLVIQIEPEQLPGDAPERYVVTQYRQWHGEDGWHSQPCGRVRGVSRAGLESVAEQMVREAEQAWNTRTAYLVVEFILPTRLLNAAVAWWRKERANEFLPDRRLSLDYPVVVRSLERLRRKDWHYNWWRKWRWLQAQPAYSRLHRSPPGVDLTQLEATLSDPEVTGMVLSEPPTACTPGTALGSDTGIKEVMTALRAGLPVIMWHRTRPTNADAWQSIQEMVADGRITSLPTSVQRLRLECLQLPAPDRSEHLGRQVALLWDDPERTPELTPLGGDD